MTRTKGPDAARSFLDEDSSRSGLLLLGEMPVRDLYFQDLALWYRESPQRTRTSARRAASFFIFESKWPVRELKQFCRKGIPMMRQQLLDFYRVHNPDNLDNLDEARPRLRRFRFLHDARGVCA